MEVEYEKYFDQSIENLPEKIYSVLNNVPIKIKKDAVEIKLRVNRKIAINSNNKTYFLDFILTTDLIKETFKAICNYSIHSHLEEIKKGFITLKGGHRAGICGTAVYENNKLINLKNISSINLRIAKQIFGVAEPILKIFNNQPKKLLIVGPPASGKTTILKDISKNLSEYSVSIVDSRGEIAASYDGTPQNDIGNADVFSFFKRIDGIIFAIRTMNPEYIICDEIGDEDDLTAIKVCVGTGVNLIATAHGENLEEFRKREISKKILETKAFSTILILKGKNSPCEINSIVKVGDLVWKF